VLASHFIAIRALHVGCVVLSGSLFCARGVLRLRAQPLANHPAVRAASYLIDTLLLTAAILLTLILREFPLTNGWLTAKLALLVLYIVLGSMALKRARTRAGQTAAFLAALATFGWIIGVAVAHDPAGWLALLDRLTSAAHASR